MMALRHPNVVGLLKVCTRRRPLQLVLEYMSGGTLEGWLPKHGREARAESLLFILHQVALGMSFVHGSKKIVHRDLAARNVLLTPDLQAKVADYGLARDVGDKMYYRMKTSRPMPIRWMAPETLREQKFSEASDVYAYGVVIFEVYSFGTVPFAERKDEELLVHLQSCSVVDLRVPQGAGRVPERM